MPFAIWESILIILPPMNVLRKSAAVIVMLFVLSLTSACLGVRLDRGEELINHPQFEQAVLNAPDFVETALEIVAELEHRLESRQ